MLKSCWEIVIYINKSIIKVLSFSIKKILKFIVIRHCIQLMECKDRQCTSKIIKANEITLKISMVTPAQLFILSVYKETVDSILWKPGTCFSALKSLKILSLLLFPYFRSNHKMCTIFLQRFQIFFHLQTGLT